MKLAKILNLLGIKLNIYRVGDIILTTNGTNPKYDYGGTWELWGAGRVPVGVDTSQNEFSQIEKTGGSQTHEHMLDKNGYAKIILKATGATAYDEKWVDQWISNYSVAPSGATSSSATNTENYGATLGGKTALADNLQPYITCYMWKKTA